MSISSALSNALTGLSAASLQAEVTSSNLANALTEGYGARSLSLSSQINSRTGGVQVNGIQRQVNQAVLAQRRIADASSAQEARRAEHLNALQDLIGTPDEGDSLSARIAELEASLIAAASQPQSTTRLDAVVTDAQGLVETFNNVSDGIQDMRSDADAQISSLVDRVNTLLTQTETLNRSIIAAESQGQSTAAFEDSRQVVLDELSRIVPFRVLSRDNGAVSLVTEGGAVLLDGSARQLSFEPTLFIGAGDSITNERLSGITLDNGQEVWSDTQQLLSGGALAAEFAIRDKSTVEAQAELDALARDLIERFEEPDVDTTRGSGQAGLFTDGSEAFDANNETGLAGRLSLNAVVDSEEGGEARYLRDGLGSSTAGAVGDASLLQRMSEALSAAGTPSSEAFDSSSGSLYDLAVTMVSHVSADRLQAESSQAFSSTQLAELQAQELAGGVDSDRELQNLLLIEQSFAANARVIETIDELMETLLRL